MVLLVVLIVALEARESVPSYAGNLSMHGCAVLSRPVELGGLRRARGVLHLPRGPHRLAVEKGKH